MKPDPAKVLLRLDEVKDRLGCCLETVRRLVRSGKLKATRPGKEWRVTEVALLDYLATGDNQ